MNNKNYRPDIDGLRAVAILVIILFHMDITFFKGGFVGVDIFFVISGFLITSIAEDALATKKFRFKEFYLKRVRRILPAYLTVILSTLVIGFDILLSNEYTLLGKSVINAIFFWSNIWLNGQSGYFDKASELKPLLHLWTLAVEAQFYFIWPLLLVFIPSKNKINVIIFACVLSLIYSLYNTVYNPTHAYYFLWSRFWQLGSGGILAFALKKLSSSGTLKLSNLGANILSSFGFLLILLAIFTFDETQRYPGWRALLPAVGALFIICAGANAFLNKKILASKIMVAIGLISYPLYLWHWPLLYFVRVTSLMDSNLTFRIFAVVLTFLLAYLTNQFVEKKFKTVPTNSPVFIKLFVIHLSIAAIGWIAARYGNFHKASDSLQVGFNYKNQINKTCLLPDPIKKDAHWCETENRSPSHQLIIGDSHAGALFPSLIKSRKPNESWQIVARAGCAPHSPWCSSFFYKISSELKSHPEINEVLLAFSARMLDEKSARYLVNEKGINHENRKTVLNTMIDYIDSLSGSNRKILFLMSPPALLSEPELCLPRPIALKQRNLRCSLPRHEVEELMSSYYSLIAEIKAKRPALIIIDPLNIFCNQKICKVVHNGESFYSYGDHISDIAALRVAELIRKTRK